MVTRLTAQGLVEHDRYRGQQLTREGRKVALELVRHHRLLEMFLVQVLGYSWDEVHDEAERLEHVMSERMEQRIFELLGRPGSTPMATQSPVSGEGALAQRASSERMPPRREGGGPGRLRRGRRPLCASSSAEAFCLVRASRSLH